jgi:glycosyltransferase involved in cell wall biosynthesis
LASPFLSPEVPDSVTIRILHITTALDLYGTARQLNLLAGGLPRAEFDVHVCALRHAGQAGNLPHDGIAVSALGQRWPADLPAFWRLKRLVAEFRPDVMHAWTPTANVYGCAAARACGVKRFVAGFRRVEPHKGPLARIIERYAARRAACVVVNSPGVRASCIARGLPAEKFRTIPNGVSPARPSSRTRQQLLADLKLPDGCRLIGAIGPLARRKRLKDAIWAADLLKVIRGDVHLLIVGDGPHRKRLEMFRDQVRIRDKVHFLGERGDVLDLLPHCDLLWSTGEYEGQCNAILEAMAAGVPVVASDIAGNRDLVVHEQTGYLVPVGDRAGFARRANRLLDDAPLAARLGRAGRARAELDFAPGRMIEHYAALYRDVLGATSQIV